MKLSIVILSICLGMCAGWFDVNVETKVGDLTSGISGWQNIVTDPTDTWQVTEVVFPNVSTKFLLSMLKF